MVVLGMANIAVAQKEDPPPAVEVAPESAEPVGFEAPISVEAQAPEIQGAPPAPTDVQPAPTATLAPIEASPALVDPLAVARAERDRVFDANRLGLPVTLLTVGTLVFGGFGLAAFGCYGDDPEVVLKDFDDDWDGDGTSCETHRVGVNLGMAAIAAVGLTAAIVGIVILVRRVGQRAGARRALRQERRALRSWLDHPFTLSF